MLELAQKKLKFSE